MFSSRVSKRFNWSLIGLRIPIIPIIPILFTILLAAPLFAQDVNPLSSTGNVVEGVEAIIGGRTAEAFEQFDSNLTAGLPFEGDEVWFVDARESHNFPGNLQALGVRRLNSETWEPAQFQDLVQSHQNDRSKVTLLYSHGDRTNEFYAIQRGLQFYRNIFSNVANDYAGGCAGDCAYHRPAIRLVIWAWKSEKVCNRPYKDFSVKSNRARHSGATIGNALAQFSDRNMVLVGYSLGAQSMLSALENGCLANNPKPGKFRVCLIAPVMEGCFVSQHRCRFPKKELVGRTIIFDNSSDRAIKCSRVLGFRTAPGGQASIQSLALNGNLPLNNIAIFDLSNSMGSKHSIVKYSADALVVSTIRELTTEVKQEMLSGIASLNTEKHSTSSIDTAQNNKDQHLK